MLKKNAEIKSKKPIFPPKKYKICIINFQILIIWRLRDGFKFQIVRLLSTVI